MLSKNKIKLIHSLSRKKQRDESELFLVEGNKMVEEALRSDFQIETLICTTEFISKYLQSNSKINELIETDSEQIQKASLLQSPQDAMALIKMPCNNEPKLNLKENIILALDFIQDPGNLGTILRIADWYGINTVVCSENTVDVYNPKVIQASMGAIFRVKSWYTELSSFIRSASSDGIPVYGTFLEGMNIYNEKLTKNGIVVLGNEGNGISGIVGNLVTNKLYIPSFSSNTNKPESLNVAIATAICCSEFKRR